MFGQLRADPFRQRLKVPSVRLVVAQQQVERTGLATPPGVPQPDRIPSIQPSNLRGALDGRE